MNMTSGPRSIQNDYASDGRKLSSRHVMSFPKIHGYTKKTTTDLYIDGLIVRDGVPFMWQFDGGYVDLDANGAATCWNYYVTDHLGSTRKVVDSNNNVKETINYYPFGSEMRMQDPAQMAGDTWQPYRFTSKELDKQNGLNWYDFGARWYDVAGVPMWTSVDPLAEKYYNVSPYAYCNNNPVMFIDPDGRDGIISIYGNNITISANVYLYGTGATKTVLQQMQDDVNNIWGKNYSVEHEGKSYNVSFDINLSLYDGEEKNNPLIIADSWNPYSRNNYIKVSDDCQRSKVYGGDEGHWRSKGRNGEPLAKDDPAPHEVGHLLGLSDQYTDENGINKGWENNIMGNSRNGKADNRNINGILENVWQEYNKWLNNGNKGEFKYEINPKPSY
jgi:RHS repeat-associated protein